MVFRREKEFPVRVPSFLCCERQRRGTGWKPEKVLQGRAVCVREDGMVLQGRMGGHGKANYKNEN